MGKPKTFAPPARYVPSRRPAPKVILCETCGKTIRLRGDDADELAAVEDLTEAGWHRSAPFRDGDPVDLPSIEWWDFWFCPAHGPGATRKEGSR